MKKTELLAPAGSFSIAKEALFSGADALYLATPLFGARAYAKNLSMEELKDIIDIAHALKKKIYVTVNTIIKDDELEFVYKYLNELYLIGVDAVIACDIAVYMYVINNLKNMECHISTQVGVKDLNDVLFFEKLGANRVVLARETSIDEIKKIKEKTNVELEVFIHGALCVSYSGGCLFSSLLSLRSGNRGRCAQNCRREYLLFEDNKKISDKKFLLSMKDLAVKEDVLSLVKLGIASLKIEGRMKDESYVKNITSYYRDLIYGNGNNISLIQDVFHRPYTKGFLFNEDKANMATIDISSNEGKMVGKVLKVFNTKVLVDKIEQLNVGDKLRFVGDNIEYATIVKIENTDDKNVIYLHLDTEVSSFSKVIYRLKGNSSYSSTSSNLLGINLFVNGKYDEKLKLICEYEGNYFSIFSNSKLTRAINKAINEEVLYNQLSKLNDTPFFIENISYNLEDGLFISLSEINELRRKMICEIYNLNKKDNFICDIVEPKLENDITLSNSIIASVSNLEQYNLCKEFGIKTIFFQNKSSYVNAKYQDIPFEEVLVQSYGGLLYYEGKEITTDQSFNVLNHDSVLHLINMGVKHITLSHEISFNEIVNLANSFIKKHQKKAPLDMIIYGKQKLMTMKYCPLKSFNLCGKCKSHTYKLKDDIATFSITHDEGCITSILNDKPLNLIDEIRNLSLYIDRFRLDFTNESKEEVIDILVRLKNGEKSFDSKKHTRGYFKRPIL